MNTVFVRKGRIQPLLQRHPWVYSSSIERVEGDPSDGDEVDVRAPDGRFLARGIWSGSSALRVRVYAHQRELALDGALIRERLAAAQRLRDALGLPDDQTDGYRVVHGDADGLPGLVVDRYAGEVCLQIGSVAFERRRAELHEAVHQVLAPGAIHEAADAPMREKEGLEPPPLSAPRELVVRERGLQFEVEIGGGQKTGFYFDQRENRARVEQLAAGRRVLDAFCYSGAFALSAARGGAASVEGVDSSRPAVERAQRNAARNGLAAEFRREDAFKTLGRCRAEQQCYEMVLLDPPPYAAGRESLPKALQKHRELLRLGLQATAAEGILVACSCSGAVDAETFERVLADAAASVRRTVRVFHRGGQAPDHPVSVHCPEGRYLHALFCWVV